jgi:PIN domain
MADEGQVYVLCDTNVGARDCHLFRKKGGPMLIDMLRAKKAKLLVPQVLREEYLKQFSLAGDDALPRIVKEVDRLKTLCGYDLFALLPKSGFGEGQANKILEELEDVIHGVPTTPELKLAAADRTMDNRRPTSKSDHGFKDCLIWESVLTLPPGSEILFVTRDEVGFFEHGALASALAKEAEAKRLKLTAYATTEQKGVTPLVEALKSRFADLSAMRTGDMPMGEHPLVQAYMESERAEPVLPVAPGVATPLLAVEPDELEKQLAARTRHLGLIDIKALGFIGFLNRASKQNVIELLVQAGIDSDAARNALERLALAGLIRDTGNNYLAVAGDLLNLAASQVEAEMIALSGLGG